MKVSIGANIINSAWGGGNQFAKLLIDYLYSHSVQVCTDLSPNDLDIILLIEPDKRLKISAYDHNDIKRYLRRKNPNCIVVHRINNTSRARDDKEEKYNKFRIRANEDVADHTVFISNWVYRQYTQSGYNSPWFSIIYNGAQKPVDLSSSKPVSRDILSIVTHHWSNNYNKGFDIYERLDKLLSHEEFSSKIRFTYIGRWNDSVPLENTKHIEPLFGDDLLSELSRHDVYLTASLNESAGMHHIEASLCGLPLLYRNSGALPEYCDGFGLMFDSEDFGEKLMEMANNYSFWQKKMSEYPHTSEKMGQDYYKLFQDLINNRDCIISRRPERKQAGFLRCLFK